MQYKMPTMDTKEIRKSTGLSQSKFAAKFNIPVRTLQEWEQSRKKPAEYIIEMIEKIIEMEANKMEKNEIINDIEKLIKDTEEKMNDENVFRDTYEIKYCLARIETLKEVIELIKGVNFIEKE